MSEWFSAPPKFCCLGLTLKPLSLGHLFLLEEVGLCQNVSLRVVSLGDLVLAVFICAFPHESSRRSISSRWLNLAIRFWRWRIGKFDLVKEKEAFEKYFEAGNQYPKIKTPIMDGHCREFGSPWAWRLLTMLMEDLRMDERTALNVPLTRANHFWATLGDRRGTLALWTESDDTLWEYAKREDLKKFGNAKN